MAFNLAYELKLIDENPMHDVKIAAHVEKKGQNLSHEEQRAFLSSIIGHPAENYFKLLLARRRNEILSLNIKDIDYKNKTLHINGTKTNSSNRTIPLFDEAAALLSVLPYNSDGFFFNFRPDYVTHAFKKNMPRTQASRLTPHLCYKLSGSQKWCKNGSDTRILTQLRIFTPM